ncbi:MULTISPECIES: hypothetical protein [Arthrobacter]|uniref:hypothetical protein n=1 Tax=Arthrobacter TaxID=1663 RepID=UPI001EEFF03A|nr:MULTISPECIES: hypothetical protein [Arthrobacter]MDP9986404.1 hypothetical protein [Arthrobacter oryzae]UKA70219.1 hypothetical protein LFT49_15950 [Arthrobacter sp. FW306-06-A]UKA74520.1 hypothetical protein LFT46_15325 [Arthrobacter sp. FW306-07-I]
MTAVLEPQAPGQSTFTGRRVECVQKAVPIALDHPSGLRGSSVAVNASDRALADPAAPFHCGTAMSSIPVPVPSLSWASTELDSREWACACGFKMDVGITADSMEAVRLESAMLESLQWEMDAAQERFENAVRAASRLGAAPEALGKAAGLAVEELQEILARSVQLF